MKRNVLILMTILIACCLSGWGRGHQAGKTLVYSVATDGFVNVREAPNASSSVVGVIATNRSGADLLSKNGKWWKVRINGQVGYVNSRFVKLSSTPVKLKNLPTVHYVVIATCESMDEVHNFFYSGPDAFDGMPVYEDMVDGSAVYKICYSCHSTLKGAKETCKIIDDLFGEGFTKIWTTEGLAECVFVHNAPSDEIVPPHTPQ